MDGIRRKPGPARRYSPEVEAEQRELAASMLLNTWAEIIQAFGHRGWTLSEGTLKKRFREWGLVKGW